ncbi:MAG: electron transport complex subunit RsxC [Blautia sp.]|nr:electron transport complex subunit RsxC [Blautia sp.]
MRNHTKFKLRNHEELEALLEGKDHLFVIACSRCFEIFESFEHPDRDTFLKFACGQGKNITGLLQQDFLCNRIQTSRKLPVQIPQDTENLVVIACGLGVQTVAVLADIPVIAACNTLPDRGHHGMALTEKKCGACAQCYLNVTGGICPVVDCAKGLLNGQCGGAKEGKCEVNPDRNCAWNQIQQRLAQQGRLEEFIQQPVQVRDYSKVNHKVIQDYVRSIRESRLEGYYGGVHPSEKKERTAQLPLKRFPASDIITIPVSMHMGAPAIPVVSVGDYVMVGQKIAKADGRISANVHSSVSGTVLAVEPRPHVTMGECISIVIKNDRKERLHESVRPNRPLEELDREEMIAIVREAGIVGMGGAGFPTHVKLDPGMPIDTVLLNGCECEPGLTADHRLLLEYTDDVLFGLNAIIKTVNAKKGVIVIEDNKQDAIEILREKTADQAHIEIVTARTKYPQGAEKMMIRRATGRTVPRGGIPADVGCIVDNVSTGKAIADAIRNGMPLIERIVTITGDRIPNPGNFITKIGTNIQEMVDACGGITGEDVTIKAGGPMMGYEVNGSDFPVKKVTNGWIAADTNHAIPCECIKCGRCVDVCPMELQPLYFVQLGGRQDYQGMLKRNIMDCVECRCCDYICSSRLPIVSMIKMGKSAIKGMKQ